MRTSNHKQTAIVIGAGFGGLAAAIRLQAQGFKTTLVEKWDKPGGRAYVFEDKGFTFDAGPTVVTDPDCLRELFTLAGKEMKDYVELLPVSPMYRLMWEDGETFDYYQDEEKLLAEIARFSPEDAARYPMFFDYTKKVFDEGYLKLGAVPFPSFWDMIKVAPQLLKLQAYRSVFSMVSKYFRDPHVRQAFSFNSLLIGGHPFRASAIYSLIHPLERAGGVWFPRGGMSALVNGLAQVFQDIGGTLLCDSPVDEILVENDQTRGVKLSGGRVIPADLVVSNADVTHTYRHFLRNAEAATPTRRSLNRKTYSPSLFVLYFGTNKKYENLKHHTVLFCSRYRELLDDIFDRGVLADDFSLYLHAPCRSDASMAPEGHDAFYVLAPVPHMGKAPINWDSMAPIYAESILQYLEERVMPGLRSSIVTKRTFTPKDFATRLHAPFGSAFSIEPTLQQSAYFRAHNADDRIDGMYIVGAGTHPGAGIPGVIGSAKATVNMIVAAAHDEVRRQNPTGVEAISHV